MVAKGLGGVRPGRCAASFVALAEGLQNAPCTLGVMALTSRRFRGTPDIERFSASTDL
jgi:hypothetical protein